jgi:hypothetical protein
MMIFRDGGERMEITVKGTAKEIADFLLVIENRQKKDDKWNGEWRNKENKISNYSHDYSQA